MPKTRNVTRAQWAEASTTNAGSRMSTRNSRNENSAKDDEKENAGRHATRSRTHRRGVVLGSANVNPTATTLPGKTATRGRAPPKGKPKAVPVKEKKQPLQDITSQFLPAPESANRGEGFEDFEDAPDVEGPTASVVTAAPPPEAISTIHARPFVSPLPPSSPPSEFPSSSFNRSKRVVHQAFDELKFSDEELAPQDAYDPWENFDDAERSRQTSTPARSNSDPFGFAVVERKLKEEREVAAALAEPEEDRADDIYEDLDGFPVADTSSPRPVRRLKRAYQEEANEVSNDPEPLEDVIHIPDAQPHFCTPPTPHKDKQKHPRLSHEGHDVFSPCSSSIESSPSPTKISAKRRFSDVQSGHDLLDEFNDVVEKSCGSDAIIDKLPPMKRTRKVGVPQTQANGQDGVARNLRPRRRMPPASEVQEEQPKRAKSITTKKLTTKPSSKSQPKEKVEDEEELEEKWRREREERVKYFKRIEDYRVEEEKVYVI